MPLIGVSSVRVLEWIDIDNGSKSYRSAFMYSAAPDGRPYPEPSIGLPDNADLVLREKGNITD